MRYEIDTVLAGARADRIEQRARGKLAAALRNMAIQVDEGMPPFEEVLLSDTASAVTERAKKALQEVTSKYELRRLDKEIVRARNELAATEQEQESFLESYLRAGIAGGETYVSTNALKDAGISPREALDLVAKGQRARFGSNA